MLTTGTAPRQDQDELNVTNLFDETYLATCLERGDCWFGSRRNVSLKATYRF